MTLICYNARSCIETVVILHLLGSKLNNLMLMWSWVGRTDHYTRRLAISLSSGSYLYVWSPASEILLIIVFPPVQSRSATSRLMPVTTIINLLAFRKQSLVIIQTGTSASNKNIGRHGIKCSWTLVSIRKGRVEFQTKKSW